jgi:hypothetical protein
MSPGIINCKTTGGWKAAVEHNLQADTEVSLLNFDCTDENNAHCRSVAKAYGMVFRANADTETAHFFRD